MTEVYESSLIDEKPNIVQDIVPLPIEHNNDENDRNEETEDEEEQTSSTISTT